MKKLSMIIPLALILCFMVGCQDKEAMAELEEFKSQAKVEEQNKALILKSWEEANKGNIDTALEMFAPEFLSYNPSNSDTPMSKEQYHEVASTMTETLPDFTHEIEEIMAVEDKVIARVMGKFTHTGEFMGIPATGKKVEVSAIYLYRIKDGKVVELRAEANYLGLFQQLGMELKPKEGEK